MADNPTSVHTVETTGNPRNHDTYQTFRQSLCAEEYQATRELYLKLDIDEGKDRSKLLAKCRRFAWFARNTETGRVHVVSNSCRLRWCPLCSSGRTGYIIHSLEPWIRKIKVARLLTLTLRHSNAPLTEQIVKLYSDFRTLRKHKDFKKYVAGGVWFFQIKLSKRADQWHPHLHCVLQGKYMPHMEISKLWLQITKGSNIVDIRLVKKPNEIAKYVARYCARPAQLCKYPLYLRTEICCSLHGRRLCGVWGTAKGVSLSPPTSVESDRFVKLGSWTVVTGIRYHNKSAEEIFACWQDKTVLPLNVTVLGFDDFLDGKQEYEPNESDAYVQPYLDGW